MIVEASFTGVIRTILIIIGAIVVLRFLGQLMEAKRQINAQNQMKENERKYRKDYEEKVKTFGKVKILGKTNKTQKSKDFDYEDVDFKEV
jgi:hypothetical protein